MPRKQSRKRNPARTKKQTEGMSIEILLRPSFGLRPTTLLVLSACMILVYLFYSLTYARFGGMNLFDFFVLILYNDIPFFYITYFVLLALFVLWSESMFREGIRRYLWYPLTAVGWCFIVFGFWNIDFTMEKYHPEISLEPLFSMGNFTYTYWDLYGSWWILLSFGMVFCIVGLFNLTDPKQVRGKLWILFVLGGTIGLLLGFYIVNLVIHLPPTRPEAIVWVGHDPFGHQAFELPALVFLEWNISLSGLGVITSLVASYLAGRER